tara:strand:- start:349 stop:2829 length:2481 start_codon:yes stop_codon:yes gene_type:complete
MKFPQLFNFIGIIVFFSSSIAIGQQTYQLEWGFNINGVDASLTIEPGDTVEWIWIDTGQHNVASTDGSQETFNSGLLQGVGTTFSNTFSQVGVNPYECSPHNGIMFGIITVASSVSDFYLAPNGVTCMCPDANFGDTGDPGNGIVYTKRVRNDITSQNASTSCTSGITDFSFMFNSATTFNQDITSWDVSNVTDMNEMFSYANSFNQPIGYWDVSSVTNMNSMFLSASAFNQPIGDWDVSQVTDMTLMFNEGSFNQPIDNWDVSNVTQMSGMFNGATAFNQPLNSWNTSNVGNMQFMFSNASSFNQDLNNWNVSSVEQMAEMFSVSAMNGLIDSWDVSSVIDMHGMFQFSPFNQDLNNWDVSSVQNMEVMFWESSFNQPIGDWNVLNVLNMYNMFIFTNFNQDISNWQFNTSVNLQGMMNHTLMSIENYDLLLASMYNQPLVNKEFGDFSLSFCNISDHDALINEKDWTFDGGQPVSTSIIAPGPVNLEVDQGSCLATGVELGSPSASGCGILTITNDAPIEFPLGITEVTWTVTDVNGTIESSSQTVEVYMISDQADLCYVSADENQPQNNRVFITSDPGLSGQNVDFHEVLREGTSGYETIGFIVPPEESFLDITSDNNTQAYRYKVQTTDICGQQLALSDFHKTILLQSGIATDNSVNLAWNPYLGYSFSSYNIYRSVNGGNYELLTSLASTNTSYNDTSADVEDNFYEYYISIDVGSCGTAPLQSFELKSNREYVNPNLSIGNNTWLNKAIILYPNPTTEIINLSTTNDVEVRSVLLYSAKGHKVIEADKTGPIDVSGLSEGIYYVTIKTNQGLVSKSVIKK